MFTMVAGVQKYFYGDIDSWQILVLHVLCYVWLYGLIVYKGCMNCYEKNLIDGVFSRFSKKRGQASK